MVTLQFSHLVLLFILTTFNCGYNVINEHYLFWVFSLSAIVIEKVRREEPLINSVIDLEALPHT